MSANSLTLKEIEEILPQRYPFLLIDRVLDYKENDFLIAVKNITGNEWALGDGQGHVDDFPQMLLVEVAAQAAIIFHHESVIKSKKKPQYFLGKVEVEFFHAAQAGDQLDIKVLAGKILQAGGYSDIQIEAQGKKVSSIRIFYGTKLNND
ncbi:MAG: 3-hydroxyacyl-[acyl-carrier-protein] dehydratase FabZ [Candidatus Omnitrophota bacterium]